MSLKVYKASAGSGKTFKLALEYIKLALLPNDPYAFSHILAVTFTNKATAEMKERILTQLYKLAYDVEDKDFQQQLEKETNLTAAELKVRARGTLQAIIHDFDHFRVETIDSFFQSMLTTLAYDLGLARNFRVSLDTDEAIERSVERLLLSVGIKGRALGRLTKSVLEYMEESIDADEGWSISRNLSGFAKKNLFNDSYLQYEQDVEAVLKDEKLLNETKRKLKAHKKEEMEAIVTQAKALYELLTTPPVGRTEVPISGLDTKLMPWTKELIEGKVSKSLNEKVKGSTKIVKALNGEIEAFLTTKKKERTEEDKVYAQQCVDALLLTEKVRQENAPLVTTIDLILKSWTPLTVLSAIGKGVTDLCDETGTFMLAKTTDLFNKMVGRDDASFVFERAGITFHHVLIDEFQDTSNQQWGIFKNLLLENMSNNDECMIVGDVKQSIYRWRGGDWSILKNIETELGHLGEVENKSMNDNYRSDRVIVNFNNDFFCSTYEQVAPKDANDKRDEGHSQLIKDIYEDVKQIPHKAKDEGYVKLMFSQSTVDKAVIMDKLYDQIHELHEHYHLGYNDMLILVRDNREGADIVNHFAQNYPHIPITSNEAFFLSASTSVKVIMAAMRCMATPEDTVAKEYCRQTLRLHLGDTPETETCIERMMTTLDEQTARWLRLPLYELCKELIRLLELTEEEQANKVEANQALRDANDEAEGEEGDDIWVFERGQSAYLFSFLDYVLEYLNENPSDVHAFINYWNEALRKKKVMMNDTGSIQIMTVHKSKGLERHTVFIPFCNWKMEKNKQDESLWCLTQHLPQPLNTMPALPISSYTSNGIMESYFAPYYTDEVLKKRIDAYNELYVAFTRPRHNLFVWSTKPYQNPDQTLYTIIGHYFYPEGLPEKSKEKKSAKEKEAVPVEDLTFEQVWEEKTFGECPVGGALPTAATEEEAKAYRPETPFDTKHTPQEEVHLQQIAHLTSFQQSNRARDFIADMEMEAEAAKANAGEGVGEAGTEGVSHSAQEGINDAAAEGVSNATEESVSHSATTAGATDLTPDEAMTAEQLAKRKQQQEYIEEGKLLHYLFSLVRTPDDIEAAGEKLWNEALLTDRKKLARLCALVRKRLAQPQIAPWFDGSWKVFAECNLLLRRPDGTFAELRPDRVMTREGETVVIDYKFGGYRPAHEEQVREYMHTLTRMDYPNVRGFLLYGYTGVVREVMG